MLPNSQKIDQQLNKVEKEIAHIHKSDKVSLIYLLFELHQPTNMWKIFPLIE